MKNVLKHDRNCSVAVPPTLHVIFILTATALFLLVAVAIGLEYNAAHSSVARLLSRLAVIELSSSVCVESRIEQSSSVYVESQCRVFCSQSYRVVVSGLRGYL